MRDLDETVAAISRFMSRAGFEEEVMNLYLATPDRVRLLAEYRLLMLDAGFPLSDVQIFDRMRGGENPHG